MCVVLQGVADVSFYFFRVYSFSLASKLLQFHRQAFVVLFLNVAYVKCNIKYIVICIQSEVIVDMDECIVRYE